MKELLKDIGSAYKEMWEEDKIRFWSTVIPSVVSLIAIVIGIVGIMSK